MEGSSRDRYGRRSSRKQLPKSFLDDDEEPLPRHTGRASRRDSGAGRKTAHGANIPSTFLDDEEEEDDDKLWFRRSRTRHVRGSASCRSSMDGQRPLFDHNREAVSAVTSGTNTPRDGSVAPPEDGRPERRARSQSIARSRSRYRKAPPKIQTNTDSIPALPVTTPTSAHPQSAVAGLGKPPMTAPATKLTHDPIPLDVYRQYVTQLQPVPSKQMSDESLGSGPKTSGSDSTSTSSEGFDAAKVLPQAPRPTHTPEKVDPNTLAKVMIVLSKKSRERFSFKRDTTVGELLDWACKKDAMTLRGAAILVERLPGFGFERALHESEIVSTVVDAMECRKEEATLYLDVDVIKSQNLRATPNTERAHPGRILANFYYAKGEDANSKIKSKRYFCLDDAKLTMSRMSSRAKGEKSSHVCNIMEYGMYTVGQYGKKRRFDVPSKCQYIIIMKALASKQMFIDQSRFFHFLATDSQEQYFEWVKALNDWRAYVYHSKEKTKAAAESQLAAKLEQESVTSSEVSETKLARLLTESKLTQKGGDALKSPGLVSPRGLVAGAMNPSAYQALSDRAPSSKGGGEGADEFLPSGLLGKAYDKKVEIRNTAPIESKPLPLERKGTLIQKAGSRHDEYNNVSMPPKTPIRERAEDRGRQGQRKGDDTTFYRDQTTSPPTRLQTSHGPNPAGMAQHISPTGLQHKPLLNFDAEEEEMYKYKKKVTGHGVEVDRAAGPLISHATEPVNPNAVNAISRSISTRMGPGRGPHPTGRARSATLKATSTKKRFEVPTEPMFENNGLTPTSSKKRFEVDPSFETNGLLASVPSNATEGHGIATGRHGSNKPLLNMALNSNFVPGSLLEQHERAKEGGPSYKKAAMYREVC
ncbi:uncharacterized protein DFL_002192 [Arthrobotrys flagrans]|uniref:PH domain-containing protein n=1 Tax=Arthrobotrys flagrans TaxID=97331 RepID=A0A437AA50_ARTFL|nr:hypothetical protein DFL_002192 [Arthrobotrys flagrans]